MNFQENPQNDWIIDKAEEEEEEEEEEELSFQW